MQQLGNGAGQLIKEFERELQAIFESTNDLCIRNHVINLRVLLHDEMKPKLRRAESAEPTQEMRQRAVEAELKRLRSILEAWEPIISMLEQSRAQQL